MATLIGLPPGVTGRYGGAPAASASTSSARARCPSASRRPGSSRKPGAVMAARPCRDRGRAGGTMGRESPCSRPPRPQYRTRSGAFVHSERRLAGHLVRDQQRDEIEPGTTATGASGLKAPASVRQSRSETKVLMSKIIGIDLGTTNSCVAIMDGKTAESDRKRRRRAHHALGGRHPGRRRAAGRPAGQAPGGDQPVQHLLRHQAPDRAQVRRPDGREGQGHGALRDRQGPERRRLGARPRQGLFARSRSAPSSCRS